MPANEFSNDDDRLRLADQIQLVRNEHGDDVAAGSDDPDDFGYLYDPRVLLVRSDDRSRVDDVLGILNDTGDFEGAVAEDPLPPDDNPREPLTLTRVVLPDRIDRNPRRVPLALDALDEREVNTDEETVVTPDHWMHLSVRGNTRLCPAIEPQETGLSRPWPALTKDPSLGKGVRVGVVDSGWHSAAGIRAATPWLQGVDGDPEHNGPMLRAYAGHGTFIAGVVRCLAPGADVRVEGFIGGSGALRESDMVRQLRQALARGPQLINLSAGATTRKNRPLLSFERFWQQDLSQTENCLLVAAAGNDATSDPFWPAAFPWAIGVGSVDQDGRVSSFSNYGVSADVYALGRNVVNAYPDGTYVCRETPDKADVRVFRTGMARWSGTSFAAPVVVGLVAAELSGGGNVVDAWRSVLARAGTTTDPAGAKVPALLPPYD